MNTNAQLEIPGCIEAEPIAGECFVSTYPPASTWPSGRNSAFFETLRTPRGPREAPFLLSVHIPFCAEKCDFCCPQSLAGPRNGVIEEYLNCVIEEAGLYGATAAISGRKVRHVSIGGGTPSILSAAQIGWLMDGLKASLDWSAVEEFSFEAAPRSVRPELLRALKDAGVTRISLGLQSMSDEVLKLNGRIHYRADISAAFRLLRADGFQNINVDLITGLIGETEPNWLESLDDALALAPESITIYQTGILPASRTDHDLHVGRVSAESIPWKEKRRRLDIAFTELDRAGYEIVSAYTAVKNEQKHRFRFQDQLWSGADLLGLGLAASSYLDGVQFQNESDLEVYSTRLHDSDYPVARTHVLSSRDRLIRELILQLKSGEADARELHFKYGVQLSDFFREQLHDLEAEGFVSVTPNRVKLTAEGLLRVDRLLPLFYDPEHFNLRSDCRGDRQ